MKTPFMFFVKVSLFLIVLLFVGPSVLHLARLEQNFLPGREIYYAVNKSNLNFNSDVVILGDSVALQLYPMWKYNNKCVSFACNQTISAAGYYILIEKYLINNKNPKAIYLVCHPDWLRNNLDQRWTYNYFMKPFYDYSKYFSPLLTKQLHNIPFMQSLHIPLFRYTNMSQVLDTKPNKCNDGDVIDNNRFTLSDISIEYLGKIKDLTARRGVEFKVISPVLSEHYRKYDSSKLIETVNKNGLEEVFSHYFDFKYLDASFFRDKRHLKNPECLGDDPLHLTVIHL